MQPVENEQPRTVMRHRAAVRPPPIPPEAAGQRGLFTRRQARASGLTDYRVRGLVESGRWIRVVGDVLTTAGRSLDRRTVLRAAVLATGGVLSHLTAAELWSLPAPRDAELLHVTVPRRSHSPVAGVRLHRLALHASEVVTFDGIAVTSRLQSQVDCLAWLPYPQAVRLLDDSLRTGLLSRESLSGRVASMGRTHGVRQLRRLVADSATGAWSRAERLLHDLLSRAGVDGWVANAPLTLPSGRQVAVDVWFPGARLAVEVDGRAWHVTADRFQGDRTRQNELLLAGIRVLRFTWDDLTQRPDGVVRAVLGAVSPEACGGSPQ